MARKARRISKIGIYHVILRGFVGDKIFAAASDKQKFIEMLQQYKSICGYQVYGYSILDNHLHLLLHEGSMQLGDIMKRLVVKYVSWYNGAHNRTGRLFYDRYKSEPVENVECLVRNLRFIHQEPVQRGIVIDMNSYQFSSQRCYNDTDGTVDTGHVIDYFGGSLVRFNKFMNELNDDKFMDVEPDKITDDELQDQLLRLAAVESAEDLQMLTKARRNKLLKEMKSLSGASIVQLSRVSGFSQSMISRA